MTTQAPDLAIRDRIRELRRVPAKDLIPNVKNWRKHPARQRQAMMAVLKEVGYADALLAREGPDGKLLLIDGHLRSEVTPDTIVPVLILDVDEQEADKILATLDPLAGMASTDSESFMRLAAGIEASTPEFADLMSVLDRQFAGADNEDKTPAVQARAITQRGDLWTLGGHRLLCGDSTSPEDVGRLLRGARPPIMVTDPGIENPEPDLEGPSLEMAGPPGAEPVVPEVMVTDPPYGVNYDPTWCHREGLNNSKRVGKVSNDDRVDWSAAYALFPGPVAYVWHAGRFAGEVGASIEKVGFQLRSQIIWAKKRFAIGRGHYHWQHEPAWYAVRKGSSGVWRGDRSQTTLWVVEPVGGDENETIHGTQKPVECMRRPILNHARAGQAVYDPFIGSGTTIIAAETCNRRAFGLEIDPVYCDVAIRRWQDFTGKDAVLEGTGHTFNEIFNAGAAA